MARYNMTRYNMRVVYGIVSHSPSSLRSVRKEKGSYNTEEPRRKKHENTSRAN